MSKDKIEVNMNVYDIPIVVEALEEANKEIERLNNIINKAIEYIENYINQFNGVYPTADMRYLDLHKLLHILKGSDKE